MSARAPAQQADADDIVTAFGVVEEDPLAAASFPLAEAYRAFLPARVDLSERFPPPGAQGNQASCVGWAVGYAARSYYVPRQAAATQPDLSRIPSPAYIYNSIRGDNCDTGSRITDALELLRAGTLAAGRFPYDERSCRRPVDADRREAGGKFTIRGWRTVRLHQDDIKGQLARGNPVVIAMRVNRSFVRHRGDTVFDRAGAAGGERVGFHAMTLTGYDETRRAFRLINSWGQRWGDNGYAWVAYDTFAEAVVSAFVMDVGTSMPPPGPAPSPPQVVPPPPEPLSEIARLARDLPCSELSMRRDGGATWVSGFVGADDDWQRLFAASRAEGATLDVAVHPWPQCEALLTLSAQRRSAQRPQIELVRDPTRGVRPAPPRPTGERVYAAGETLAFDVIAPPFSSYLYVTYVQADGEAVHLLQPSGLSTAPSAGRARFRFGDGAEGRPRFRVSAPFGPEMLIVVASSAPLYPSPRPSRERERDYLTALRQALLAPPAAGRDGARISADYMALLTSSEASR